MKSQLDLLSHFRSVLVTRLNDMVPGHHESFLELSSGVANQGPMDEVDVATAGRELETLVRRNGRNQELILEIREALRRIEIGVFGTCRECGSAIHIERLRAQPMSTLCIECQRELEEAAMKMRRQLS